MDEPLPVRRKTGTLRGRSQKGAEVVEFSLVLLPLMASIIVMLDIGWAIFAKSTLQRAVRVGVTLGRTLTASDIAQGCLTATVKSTVQQNAFGLLAGNSGLSYIQVNYLTQPVNNGPIVDVSSQTYGNTPGNLIQVSVKKFPLMPLVPRIVNWNSAPDNAPMTMSVYSVGLIEPSHDLPCIGTAP